MAAVIDYSDFRSAVLMWAREHSVTDAAIVSWGHQLSTELADCSRGKRSPKLPERGLCVIGECGPKTRKRMWWRVGCLDDGCVMLEGELPYGTCNVAELLGIVWAHEWAEQEQYEGPVWVAGRTASHWWANRAVMPSSPVPEVAMELIRHAYTVPWGRDVERWKESEWGEMPFQFAGPRKRSKRPSRRRSF